MSKRSLPESPTQNIQAVKSRFRTENNPHSSSPPSSLSGSTPTSSVAFSPLAADGTAQTPETSHMNHQTPVLLQDPASDGDQNPFVVGILQTPSSVLVSTTPSNSQHDTGLVTSSQAREIYVEVASARESLRQAWADSIWEKMSAEELTAIAIGQREEDRGTAEEAACHLTLRHLRNMHPGGDVEARPLSKLPIRFFRRLGLYETIWQLSGTGFLDRLWDQLVTDDICTEARLVAAAHHMVGGRYQENFNQRLGSLSEAAARICVGSIFGELEVLMTETGVYSFLSSETQLSMKTPTQEPVQILSPNGRQSTVVTGSVDNLLITWVNPSDDDAPTANHLYNHLSSMKILEVDNPVPARFFRHLNIRCFEVKKQGENLLYHLPQAIGQCLVIIDRLGLKPTTTGSSTGFPFCLSTGVEWLFGVIVAEHCPEEQVSRWRCYISACESEMSEAGVAGLLKILFVWVYSTPVQLAEAFMGYPHVALMVHQVENAPTEEGPAEQNE